jgi:threonyl-tRNA synthetase
MNCLVAYTIYNEKLHSFSELPLRLAELTGMLHRNELSGALAGMFRTRQFVQDDTHIFVAPSGLEAELGNVVDFGLFMLRSFGFESFKVGLSVRDPANVDKFLGTDDQWENAEGALKRVADERGIEPEVMFGEAKFYGPSLDIHVRDALGRFWQCTTVQIDFNAPERFDLEFVDSDGERHRPLVIHRALIGSFERFMAVLTEHYAGAFPVWLAPVQVQLIPIADRHLGFAEQVAAGLRAKGIRVEVDERREKINAKIRDAQLMKVPFMLIVGDKEIEANAVSVRLRTGENLGSTPIEEFADRITRLVAARSLGLVEAEAVAV